MKERDPQLMADLLGFHLDIADEEARARVASAFPTPDELAAARAAVQKALAPLDADPAPEPPADLVARVLDRISAVKNTLPMSTPLTPADAEHATAGRPFLSMRDLVGLAAAILIFAGIFVPGYRSARQASQRIACANNLRAIGNGYASYAEIHGNQWPYAGAAPPGASWIRTENPHVPRASNSRHVWTLLRDGLTPAQAFTCPSRAGDVPLRADVVHDFDDFPSPLNNSYSTNMIIRPLRKGDFGEHTPLAADLTPLVDSERRLIRADNASTNSHSHGTSRGQNVLRANISVRFFKRPNVGIGNDDIYRLVGVQKYTGHEQPRSPSDAFLIP
jgi:hypothetical protein